MPRLFRLHQMETSFIGLWYRDIVSKITQQAYDVAITSTDLSVTLWRFYVSTISFDVIFPLGRVTSPTALVSGLYKFLKCMSRPLLMNRTVCIR